MRFRHEYKEEINLGDIYSLRQRLNAVCYKDAYCQNGMYVIRSLYFDNAYDKALNEKINGVNEREKFRLRIYNGDTQRVFLEKKSKINGLCSKERLQIPKETAQAIIAGDYSFVDEKSDSLLIELLFKSKTQGLKPKTIVQYTRDAYVFPAGNVRVTIDMDIKTGLNSVDFLNTDCPLISPDLSKAILEVKYDEFLPDIVRNVIQLSSRSSSAFSKYAECRKFG